MSHFKVLGTEAAQNGKWKTTYGSIKVQAIKQNLNERVESTWKSFQMEPDPLCPIFGH
jgi:hypothetical protein